MPKVHLVTGSDDVGEVWIEVNDLVHAIEDPALVLEYRDGVVSVVAVNTAAVAMFDQPVAAILGTGFAALHRPEELVRLEQRVREVLATGRSSSYEIVRELPRRRFVFESSLMPLADDRVLGIGRDVSVHDEALDRAAELERLTGTGTWSWSLADDSVRCSPELERVLAVPAGAEVDLEAVVARLDPEDVEALFELIHGVVRSGRDAEGEYRLRGADGSARRILARVGLVRDVDGRPVRLHGTMQDVTERRRLEQREHQAAAAARQLDRALQLNDDVVQALARATLALKLGWPEEVDAAVRDGTDTVRAIMGELLRSTTAFGGGLRSGDLRRRPARSGSGVGGGTSS